MAENEQTLEELMAELDAGLDLNDNTSETKPNESEDAKGVTADNASGDEMDTDNFVAELERMAETPVPAPAPEPAPAPAPAPALASTAPAQPVAALATGVTVEMTVENTEHESSMGKISEISSDVLDPPKS